MASILSSEYAGLVSFVLPLAQHPPPADALPACVSVFMSAVHAAMGKTTAAQVQALAARELPAITRKLLLRLDSVWEEALAGGAPAGADVVGDAVPKDVPRVAAARLLDPTVFPLQMLLDALRAVQIDAGVEADAPLVPPTTL